MMQFKKHLRNMLSQIKARNANISKRDYVEIGFTLPTYFLLLTAVIERVNYDNAVLS